MAEISHAKCASVYISSPYILTISTGALLLRRLTHALVEGKEHIEIFEEFTQDVEASHSKQLEEWSTAITAYEVGQMSPDNESPYDIAGEGEVSLNAHLSL